MIYEMCLWTSARCVVWFLVAARMAIEPKYHIDSYRYISHISTTQIFDYDLGPLFYQFSIVRVTSNTKQTKNPEYLTVIQ